MGPWPDGSRRFRRPISSNLLPRYGDGFKYYLFGVNGEQHVIDSTGRFKWRSILSLDVLLASHPNTVELFPPELSVSEGL